MDDFKKEKINSVMNEEEEDKLEMVCKWIFEDGRYTPDYNIPKIELGGKFSPKPFADEIQKFYKFKYDNFRRFWVWDRDSGLWLEDAENFIKKQLRDNLLFNNTLKTHYVEEIMSHIKDTSWTRELPEDVDKNIIAFKNCLGNIDTGEMIPFDEKYFITSKINLDLNPTYKTCPKIDKFFEDIVGFKNKSMLYDLIAYCFFRGYYYQKMFILHGGGENGKTTYLDLLTYCLGKQNVSSETPQELCAEGGFSKGYLWGKFANVSSELPYSALNDTDAIKSLSGDEGTIKCNRKFKEPFNFKSFAKLIFAGNELPATNDNTYAFARRLYIIKFPKKIENPIRGFLDTLLTKEELCGLAWICFQRLRLMKERGWCFEIDVNVEEMLKTYEELSNPLSKFLKDETEDGDEEFIFKYEFKQDFESWCKGRNFRIWGDSELHRFMKEKYSEGKRSVYINNEQKRYNAWIGLKFKNKVSSNKTDLEIDFQKI